MALPLMALFPPCPQKEADAFFCFEALMKAKGHYKMFCRAYDADREAGVLGRANHVARLLSVYDKALYDHLFRTLKLEPQFFVMRWILLFLTQEIALSEGILHIWDAVLSEATAAEEDASTQLIYFVCLAILERLRQELLAADFTQCMQRLQRLPPFNPRDLARRALAIRNAVRRPQTATSSLFWR